MARTTCENILSNDIKCHRDVRYNINKVTITPTGTSSEETKQWLHVCGTCDRAIGRHNLMLKGWSIKEAIQWERDPEMATPKESHLTPHQQRGGRLTPSQIRSLRAVGVKRSKASTV